MEKVVGVGVSLSSLNATKASEKAFEFEYITPDGSNSGIFFSVLGAQADSVVRETARMINERRKKQAAREALKHLRQKGAVEFDTIESEVEFGQRMAASRLTGWRGITDPFTPENALLLCQTNKFIAQQIIDTSDDIANFMPR